MILTIALEYWDNDGYWKNINPHGNLQLRRHTAGGH